MKNMIKYAAAFLLLTFIGTACKKDENKIYFEGGTAPVLTSSLTTPIVLSAASKTSNAVTLSWTNPNYNFNTGISSQDVSYTLQIDTTGSNFTNPNIVEKSFSKDLSVAITVGDLNNYMTLLMLAENIPHNMEARVKSSLTGNAVPLYSNVVKFIATPYLDVAVPIPPSGTIFITGSATPSGWVNNPPTAQQFTQVSSTDYVLNSIYLTATNSYTFLFTYGSWDNKYSIATKNDPNEMYGGAFQLQGNDILAPSADGYYKIEMNFKVGKFTVTKL